MAPVDVLVGMGLLYPEHLDDWRRGRLPYLERVVNRNLTRLLRLATVTDVDRTSAEIKSFTPTQLARF